MKEELRIALRIVLVAIVIAGIIVVYHWAADKFRAPTIIATTQQAATTPSGVQAAASTAKVPLQGRTHAENISKAVMAATEREPDEKIATTGSEWEKVAEKIRARKKADFVMVTDPARPTEKPAPKKEDAVTLNAYYVKAYPNNFQQIGFAPPATAMASASWKIGKTKTKEWYVGAWGMADFKRPEQSRIGVVFTRM